MDMSTYIHIHITTTASFLTLLCFSSIQHSASLLFFIFHAMHLRCNDSPSPSSFIYHPLKGENPSRQTEDLEESKKGRARGGVKVDIKI